MVRSANGRPFAAMQANEIPSTPVAGAVAAESGEVRAARHYRLTTNSTSFLIDAPSAGLAVLQETFWPRDFIVTLNGERARVLRANHTFKGVWLPAAGTYEVRFTYRPHRWSWSLALGGLGAVVTIALLLAASRPERTPPWVRRALG